ncbi:flagellin [Pedococcus aerophilus]|uniref:Flagellin n=1 Tax=Pedococcus aerophilus TaxID=436356 RepID=A0ABN3URI6_9MICO
MGLQINTNVSAMNAYRNLSSTQNAMSTSLERLSSGLRINKAADDAAGLAISEKLRAQSNGLNQAVSNAQDGISLIQTAEGALNETHSILQRMRTLAVQSANDTNSVSDREAIQKEVTQLSAELNKISERTQFNGQNLLDGSFTGKSLQLGANSGQNLSVTISGTSTASLSLSGADKASSVTGAVGTISGGTAVKGQFTVDSSNKVLDTAGNAVGVYDNTAKTATFSAANGGAVVTFDKTVLSGSTGSFSVTSAIDVTTQSGANTALSTIDAAITTVSGQRADLGAIQNRLQHTINSLSVAAENASAAESRIRDTDMAKEMTSFTRSQILQQAGVSMLAQANSAPQSVLKLLG